MKVSSTALFAPDVSSDLYTNRRVWNDELVKATTRARVIAIWEVHGSQFSCVNISTALISFAKWEITVDAEKCICSMLKHYLENHRLIRVRDAAGTVDSLARMHFTGKEIEQIQEKLFAVIAQKVLDKRVFFDKPHPASLVHLLQNFVDVDSGGDALFRALVPEVVRDLASFNPQDVTKIATLYSKKGCRAELLFQAIQNQVMKSIVHYTPSQLSHIASACSSFAIGVPEFYSECYFKIKKGLHKLDAAGIESCLYVYAQSNEKEALLGALEAVITSKKSEMSQEDFVSTLATCAKMQFGSDDFFQAMESEVLVRLEHFDSQSLASIAFSFASMLAGSVLFFSSIEKKVVANIEQFETQELVQIYHAYSISRIADGAFLSKIERQFESKGDLELQDVVLVIWSMLLARSIEGKYLVALLGLLNQAFEANELSSQNLQKLTEIELMIKADAPELYGAINKALLDAIASYKQEALLCILERSSLQIEVEEALVRCGYECKSQLVLDGVSVGIFIPSENLVIEVCEKSSYYRADPNELAAVFLIKKRILESRGYKMLHLPYFEWSWSKKVQEQYLKELIAREYKPINELTYNPRREL